MIRVLVVDDHPAMRAGLTAVLEAEPEIVPVGAATGEHDIDAHLRTARPDVVLLDYHLTGTDGLRLCLRVKSQMLAPKVIIYSAYADSAMALLAQIAGADGMLDKAAPANEVYQAIRAVNEGQRILPPIPDELVANARAALAPADVAILEALIAGTARSEIAAERGLTPQEIAGHVDEILLALRIETPAQS